MSKKKIIPNAHRFGCFHALEVNVSKSLHEILISNAYFFGKFHALEVNVSKSLHEILISKMHTFLVAIMRLTSTCPKALQKQVS